MSSPTAIREFLLVFTVALVLGSSEARPAEPPTKFSLETSPGSTKASPTKWDQGMELLGRVGDALRFGRGRLINSAMMARNIIAERAEDFASEARNNVASVIAAKNDILAQGSTAISSISSAGTLQSFLPVKARETVRLESEKDKSLLEAPKPNPISRFLENYLKPIPLVDKIREDEKFGNSGDKFIGIGRALVGSLEGLGNFLNAIVEFPIDTAKKTSRGITEALNQLGGKLVGLQ